MKYVIPAFHTHTYMYTTVILFQGEIHAILTMHVKGSVTMLIQWRIQGVAMVSAETPSENMRALHPINEWTGGRYFLCNSSSDGIQEVAEY